MVGVSARILIVVGTNNSGSIGLNIACGRDEYNGGSTYSKIGCGSDE